MLAIMALVALISMSPFTDFFPHLLHVHPVQIYIHEPGNRVHKLKSILKTNCPQCLEHLLINSLFPLLGYFVPFVPFPLPSPCSSHHSSYAGYEARDYPTRSYVHWQGHAPPIQVTFRQTFRPKIMVLYIPSPPTVARQFGLCSKLNDLD